MSKSASKWHSQYPCNLPFVLCAFKALRGCCCSNFSFSRSTASSNNAANACLARLLRQVKMYWLASLLASCLAPFLDMSLLESHVGLINLAVEWVSGYCRTVQDREFWISSPRLCVTPHELLPYDRFLYISPNAHYFTNWTWEMFWKALSPVKNFALFCVAMTYPKASA